MRWGIFGVGALGALFGARLAPFVELTLFGHWAEQVACLNDPGLIWQDLEGMRQISPLNATTELPLLRGIDLALVLVKSQQTENTAVEIATVLKPDGLVVTLQNGLGNREKLERFFRPEQIVIGTTAQGANIPAVGELIHAGNGITVLQKHARSQEVARCFQQAGIETEIHEAVEPVIWGKLVANAGINPLTALLGWPNGALAEDRRAREMMCAAAEETAAVARALNIKLAASSASEMILAVAQRTAANRSSMLQDIGRGAQTEIEAICGEVVRLGEQTQVAVPTNRFLRQLIQAQEKKNGPFWPIETLYRKWMNERERDA